MGAITWIDTNGNLWLFGSQLDGFDANGVDAYLDDVWEYSPTQGWTWVAGTNSVPTASSNGCIVCAASPGFGTYQTPAPGNSPGSLQSPAQWVDKAGNLWLFGGYQNRVVGGGSNPQLVNSLWEFNVSSHEWAWMGGSNAVNGYAPAIYGTQGVAAPGNTPGGRAGAASWIDSAGNFWLFGGYGEDSAGNSGYLNDLWMFSLASNQWTWMAGGNAPFTGTCLAQYQSCTEPGVPGTLQIPAIGNMPQGRSGASVWTDKDGNLWLFGGELALSYNDLSGTTAFEGTFINDLWEFDIRTHEWTWMAGSAALTAYAPYSGNTPGMYGTLGTPAAGNTPGGRVSRWRQANYTWTDSKGQLWLWGGNGFDSASKVGQLNDLWMFNTLLKQWTWMGGSSTFVTGCVNGSTTCSKPGVYGSLGTPAATNAPGAHGDAVQWMDPTGNVWFFGGPGIDSVGTWGMLNDLWKFDPSTDEWTWMGGSNKVPNDGSNTAGQFGVYGQLGVEAPTNTPGGRQAAASWTDGSGNFWMFGGNGCSSNYCEGWLNDLWKYTIIQPAASTPIFSPGPGTYTGSQKVTLSDTTSGAAIYYTTDGSAPTANSTLYADPILVSASETIHAIAIANGYSNSSVGSATYTINLPPPTFTFTVPPTSISVNSGSQATTTLTITPQYGFNAAVTFACSGLPANATCSFNPATIIPQGTAVTAQLTIALSTQAGGMRQDLRPLLPTGLAATVCFFLCRRRRAFGAAMAVLLALIGAGLFCGCSGGGASTTGSGTGVSPQNYTITVTATSGTVQQTASVLLKVS